MAFWAFDKISKAKNYVKKNFGHTINDLLRPEEDPQQVAFTSNPVSTDQVLSVGEGSSFLQIIPKPPTPVQFEVQLQQYQKLCRLEQDIVRKLKNTQVLGLQSDNEGLQSRLKDLQVEREKSELQKEKQQVYKHFRSGQLSLQSIIQQNLVMRQKLQELRLSSSFRNSY